VSGRGPSRVASGAGRSASTRAVRHEGSRSSPPPAYALEAVGSNCPGQLADDQSAGDIRIEAALGQALLAREMACKIADELVQIAGGGAATRRRRHWPAPRRCAGGCPPRADAAGTCASTGSSRDRRRIMRLVHRPGKRWTAHLSAARRGDRTPGSRPGAEAPRPPPRPASSTAKSGCPRLVTGRGPAAAGPTPSFGPLATHLRVRGAGRAASWPAQTF